MSLEQAEEFAASPAPKIEQRDIEAAIKHINFVNAYEAASDHYWRYAKKPVSNPTHDFVPWQLRVMTLCFITMQNGYVVTGQSACAAPENYDPKIGEKFALEDAKRKIWPLLGYKLRDDLDRGASGSASNTSTIGGGLYASSELERGQREPEYEPKPFDLTGAMESVNAAIRRELDQPMELTPEMEIPAVIKTLPLEEVVRLCEMGLWSGTQNAGSCAAGHDVPFEVFTMKGDEQENLILFFAQWLLKKRFATNAEGMIWRKRPELIRMVDGFVLEARVAFISKF